MPLLQKRDWKATNPGTPTVPKYKSIVNQDGTISLIPDGVRYLQAEIQSYEEQCNVNNIMRRYQAGDVNALGSMQGTFADIFDLPQTRQEALQAVMDAHRTFEQLPLDVKNVFNGSWEAFYLAGPEAVYKAFGVDPGPGPIIKEPAEPVEIPE